MITMLGSSSSPMKPLLQARGPAKRYPLNVLPVRLQIGFVHVLKTLHMFSYRQKDPPAVVQVRFRGVQECAGGWAAGY